MKNKYTHEEAIRNIYPWIDSNVVELDYLLDGEPKNGLNAWLTARAYDDGEGHVAIHHPDHQIDIWVRRTKGWTRGDGTLPYTFTLEFNGKFIKSGKIEKGGIENVAIPPII